MLELRSAVVCESATTRAPHTLRRVRKRWRTPPARMWVYLEIFNPAEADFDVTFQMFRGPDIVIEYETELILGLGQDSFEHVVRVDLPTLEPKTYLFAVLLNGRQSHTILLDFGHPKAPQ